MFIKFLSCEHLAPEGIVPEKVEVRGRLITKLGEPLSDEELNKRLWIFASCVWIGGLPKTQQRGRPIGINERLRDIFRNYKVGKIEHVQARGSAYVSFEDYREAKHAVRWLRKEGEPTIEGKRVRVGMALGSGFAKFFRYDTDRMKRDFYNENTGECLIPFSDVPPVTLQAGVPKAGDLACLMEGNFVNLHENTPQDILYRFGKKGQQQRWIVKEQNIGGIQNMNRFNNRTPGNNNVRMSNAATKNTQTGPGIQNIQNGAVRPSGPAPGQLMNDQQAIAAAAALNTLNATNAIKNINNQNQTAPVPVYKPIGGLGMPKTLVQPKTFGTQNLRPGMNPGMGMSPNMNQNMGFRPQIPAMPGFRGTAPLVPPQQNHFNNNQIRQPQIPQNNNNNASNLSNNSIPPPKFMKNPPSQQFPPKQQFPTDLPQNNLNNLPPPPSLLPDNNNINSALDRLKASGFSMLPDPEAIKNSGFQMLSQSNDNSEETNKEEVVDDRVGKGFQALQDSEGDWSDNGDENEISEKTDQVQKEEENKNTDENKDKSDKNDNV